MNKTIESTEETERKNRIKALRAQISVHMEQLYALFPPHVLLTLIIRDPYEPEGMANGIYTADRIELVQFALQQLMDQRDNEIYLGDGGG